MLIGGGMIPRRAIIVTYSSGRLDFNLRIIPNHAQPEQGILGRRLIGPAARLDLNPRRSLPRSLSPRPSGSPGGLFLWPARGPAYNRVAL